MWGLFLLEFINVYAVESDHTLVVCVLGHWVARIFWMTYYTHHSCVRMYIVQGEEFVAVVSVFHVANKLTPFW